MSDEIDPEIVRKTQKTLGKYIKKPQLTDKLLSKPPFRFLHDVVTAVIKNTGFLKGVFTEEQLNYDKVKEKDAKLKFLTKLIEEVKSVTEKDLKVRANKIVAGAQPNETNRLLQAIAVGIENNLKTSNQLKEQKIEKKNSKDLSSSRNKELKTPKEDIPRKSKTKESPKEKKNKIGKEKKDKDKSPSGKSTSKTDGTKKSINKEEIILTPDKNDNENILEETNERPRTRDIENGFLSKIKSDTETVIESSNKQLETMTIKRETISDTIIPRLPSARPKSARPKSGEFKEKIKQPIVDNEPSVKPKSALRPPSVRPSSARPGAPRLRPDSALPMQEIVPMGKINVIVENFDKDIDDEDIVVIQTALELPTVPDNSLSDLTAKNKSHLVEQILDQIKDGEDVTLLNQTDSDWDQGVKGRETTCKEMNALRDLIQTCSKTANPLSKLLNYLHEDVENMFAELQLWNKTKLQLFEEIEIQKRKKREMEKPLLEKFQTIKEDITKLEMEISSTRSKILKTDERIKELISIQ